MKTKSQNMIIATSIIGALAVGVTILIARRRKLKKLQEKIESGNVDLAEEEVETVSQSNVAFPLKRGSGYSNEEENKAVKVVQRYLNSKIASNSYIGVNVLDEDGKFGPATERALLKIAGVSTVTYSLFGIMFSELFTSVMYV